MTLWAEDSVGLKTQLISPTVVVDTSPPDQGTVVCPSFIQVRRSEDREKKSNVASLSKSKFLNLNLILCTFFVASGNA